MSQEDSGCGALRGGEGRGGRAMPCDPQCLSGRTEGRLGAGANTALAPWFNQQLLKVLVLILIFTTVQDYEVMSLKENKK